MDDLFATVTQPSVGCWTISRKLNLIELGEVPVGAIPRTQNIATLVLQSSDNEEWFGRGVQFQEFSTNSS